MRAALSEPGFEITEHQDPSTVAEAVTESGADVVIVDLQVRSMGGMAVTRLLRHAAAQGNAPDVPIVLLLDRRADVFLARRSGAHAWVQKPFDANELREALKAAGDAASAEAEARA